MTTYNLRKDGRLYNIELERDDYANFMHTVWTARITQDLGSVSFQAKRTQNEDPTGLLNEIFEQAEELIARTNGKSPLDGASLKS